ncbi:MAG: hypothetical protein ABIG52_00710 [Nanoarchaeota archaeon]|nr:hypothetical protein [Nanoarchaeota archaeon]MBU1644326.1 hypothetical protein [Nanoarchaeota archaeon]
MDVERIQKINNLALDLMKQGLASDRQEAVAQAEKIFRTTDTEDYNSIRERMNGSKNESQNNQEKKEDLSQEQIKDILEQNTKFLVKKITQFQDQIINLKKEIDDIKNQSFNRIPTVKELIATEVQKQSEIRAQPQNNSVPQPAYQEIPKQESKPSSAEPHPRLGGYKQEDVSVEKFFYMGKGK